MNKILRSSWTVASVIATLGGLMGCATPGYQAECGKIEDMQKKETCIAKYYDRVYDEETGSRDIAATRKEPTEKARAAAASSINAHEPMRLQPKHIVGGN